MGLKPKERRKANQMAKGKRVYSEAQLQVVQLSGKTQLLAESSESPAPGLHQMSLGAQRQDYTMGSAFQ